VWLNSEACPIEAEVNFDMIIIYGDVNINILPQVQWTFALGVFVGIMTDSFQIQMEEDKILS
jgi:hypothetical protein